MMAEAHETVVEKKGVVDNVHAEIARAVAFTAAVYPHSWTSRPYLVSMNALMAIFIDSFSFS